MPDLVDHPGIQLSLADAQPVAALTGTLAEAVAALLDDRDRAREIGFASLRFARLVHDGRAAVGVLTEFLEG